ncbi:MAG: PAS domain-containing protein [Acidobacteria bacterium]|nr:PAS domain-containing protein [Acidobacteriota bacterium]
MATVQPARSLSRAKVSPSAEAARLELLEYYLLHHEDLARCAHASLEWLARHAGVKRSMCLVVDGDGGVLMGMAGYGVPSEEVELFAWPLSDARDPIVAALSASSPVLFRAGRGNGHAGRPTPVTPLGAGPFTAVPLRGVRDTGQGALGLLLLRSGSGVSSEISWLAIVLGQKLDQLRGRGSIAGEVRKLRRERSLLFTIINAVTDPILLTDTEGRLIVANARAERLFASSEEESEGRRRAVELNNMLFSAALSRTAVERPAEARELLLVDPSEGSDLLFEVLSSTVEDPREGTGVVSVLRNITDLRRATEQIEENYQRLRVLEAAARTERDRLNLIIDSVADPIIVTDPMGETILMNAPAEELFTVPPDAPESAERNVQANDAHFSSFISGLLLGETGPGAVRRGEIGLASPSTSEPIPVEAIAGKVLTETGELTAVVTILHDRREALERARLYEQLKLASEELQARVQAATAELATQNELLRRQAIELEQASRLKSQFLANMSHEFRTPLNAILGYTHMLLQGVAGDLLPAVKRQLQRIDSNARHLLTIINEILDITRIEAGKMPIQLSEFNVNEIVPEVMAELEAVIARSKLTITPKLAPGAPLVRSDRQKVKQIVVNLLSNALKFTHQGGIEIAVQFDPEAQTVSIAVTDTGIGIAPEHHERIFEDFRQVDDSPSRQYGGTGLGLAISRRLATALGGRITLRSSLGQGSTFTLTIPPEAPR